MNILELLGVEQREDRRLLRAMQANGCACCRNPYSLFLMDGSGRALV